MSTKDIVLKKLSENPGKEISGEELASLCSVSRAAVWKAVNSIREKGFDITGTTNGGYVFSENQDILSADSVQSCINKSWPEFSDSAVDVFSEIDSTNTYAKSLIAKAGAIRDQNNELTQSGKELHRRIVIAEKQTQGRGRLGRTFVSPAKTGIYTSVIYAPAGGITKPAYLTAGTGVAVCRTIKKLFGLECGIKWINDIFLNGKKICGILTEGISSFETGRIEACVIGFGINLLDNPEVFGNEISKVAGSVLGSAGKDVKISRAQIAAEAACQVLKILEEEPEKVMEEYKKLCFMTGMTVKVYPVIGDEKSMYEAKVIDIDKEAGLVVQCPDGSTKTLTSGEVSIHSDSFTKNN